MSEKFNELKPFLEKSKAINASLVLFSWDNETLAPVDAMENTAMIIEVLSNEYFNTIMNENVKRILHEIEDGISNSSEELNNIEMGIYKELKKNFEKLENIPASEYSAFSSLIPRANKVWAKARENNNFTDFSDSLKKIVEYSKKFAKYRSKDGQHPYNVLLEDFEEGFTMDVLDDFFGKIKKEIVPLLQRVTEKNNEIDKNYNNRNFDVNKQKEFSRWISEYVGFDFNRGVLSESAHPFTTNLHNHDVRITTHFFENNLESAIFSTIHETGHAIYEQGIMDELTQTILGEGTSSGMHESQSRFYENVIGRSKEFWIPIYEKLREKFNEELKDIDLDKFIKGINKAHPGFIRTEADELTYCLHIIVRYEIEKMIFNEEADILELPKIWNDKYEEYLGIRPENNSVGILQDIHWSCGEFGYFPSYAVGNAIAAQLLNHIKKELPLEECLISGDFKRINDYLKEHIHQYGKLKNTNQILIDMTGEEFNPDYYINYLKEKYEKIYEL